MQDDDRTMQFFKEERTDDAVYNVYLKKVQYHIDSNSSVLIWLLLVLSLNLLDENFFLEIAFMYDFSICFLESTNLFMWILFAWQ